MPAHRHTREEAIASFWKRVGEPTHSGCREWSGSIQSKGYGVVLKWPDRAQHLAHRFAWELANGQVPAGMCVCHHCDNPKCCNLDHLFLGTHADNMRDKVAKGRAHRLSGERQPQSKLTAPQVVALRAALARGDVLSPLARELGVDPGTASRAARGHSWRHVI